jgi:hypothetical protein
MQNPDHNAPAKIMRNPNHPVPTEVVDFFTQMQDENIRALDSQAKLDTLARPNSDERRNRQKWLVKDGLASLETLAHLEELRKHKFNRFSDGVLATAKFKKWSDYMHDQEQAPVAPIDHTFWWAETDPFIPGHMAANWGDDGLHFTGGPTHHDGDLFNTNFGATAFFEIQRERLPTSSSGRFISTPHIELFGGLLGYTGDDDITTGDLWSKCWLHLRQTVLQFGLGPTGPSPIVLGNAETHDVLIFEENADRSVHVNMPGLKLMPAVAFGGVNPASPLFAHLEVRFDIQLEGAGTLIWCDPEVLLRTFQWPLQPI